jgi:hypothetical protein
MNSQDTQELELTKQNTEDYKDEQHRPHSKIEGK